MRRRKDNYGSDPARASTVATFLGLLLLLLAAVIGMPLLAIIILGAISK